jgi:periplasmic divalent cation tolerance protein
MTDFQLVLTTVDNSAVADKLARLLVEAGAAACVSILPGVTSVYRWKNAVETAAEFTLLIKTRAADFMPVRDLIIRHHPYECPEIIAVPIVAGSDSYLLWLSENTAFHGGTT